MDFNSDELNHPTWMDKEFFETVLSSYEKDYSIKITDLTITPGSGKGDHFASIMFRAVVEYSSSSSKNNSRSMIIKTIPDEEGFKKEMLEKSAIFDTEIDMYAQELPKFEDILRQHGDNTQLCTKMLYHSFKPRKVIVFEDLVPQGYSCIRDRFLNIDEIKACYSKLAKWHAVSYKLGLEGDESVKKYQNGIFSGDQTQLPAFITKGLQRTIDLISKIDGLQAYSDKLQPIEPTLISKCNELHTAYGRHHKAIMVLNHGDFHGKNVMFKHDKDGNYEDVMLIDFQICCYAPSVIDVTYSIYTLLSEELRANNREELIYYYFSIFLETLKKIEFAGEMPTLIDFYMDMYRYKEFELWAMSTFLPMMHEVVNNKEEGVELENLISSDDNLTKMHLNDSFIRELKNTLPKLLHKGYLG